MCSLEERLPSSGSVEAPLSMDLDPASTKAEAASLVDSSDASGSPMMPADSVPVEYAAASGSPVARGNQFSFPPVLEDAPSFSIHAKGSFGSKSTLRKEAI